MPAPGRRRWISKLLCAPPRPLWPSPPSVHSHRGHCTPWCVLSISLWKKSLAHFLPRLLRALSGLRASEFRAGFAVVGHSDHLTLFAQAKENPELKNMHYRPWTPTGFNKPMYVFPLLNSCSQTKLTRSQAGPLEGQHGHRSQRARLLELLHFPHGDRGPCGTFCCTLLSCTILTVSRHTTACRIGGCPRCCGTSSSPRGSTRRTGRCSSTLRATIRRSTTKMPSSGLYDLSDRSRISSAVGGRLSWDMTNQ